MLWYPNRQRGAAEIRVVAGSSPAQSIEQLVASLARRVVIAAVAQRQRRRSQEPRGCRFDSCLRHRDVFDVRLAMSEVMYNLCELSRPVEGGIQVTQRWLPNQFAV